MLVRLDTPALEFADRERLQQIQDDLLRRQVRLAFERTSFYRRRLEERGLSPEAVRGVRDLCLLPFTSKADLERSGADFLAAAEQEIIDLCLTSGTTGQPISLWQTQQDLERLAYNEEFSFRAMGLGPGDRVLLAVALDRCFMAGLAYFLGLLQLGAKVIRGGSSSQAFLLELLRSQAPTAIVGVPSLLLALAERLQASGVDPAAVGIKRLVCIGEPVRTPELVLSPLGGRLQQLWRAQIFGTYASTEMAAAFSDCSEGRGGHVRPELVAIEIVDEAGEVLPPGHAGEVVATPLQVSGMPLLRFRTGDIAVLHDDPCPCGRQTPRLGPILGRRAQMLKVRGTTVFPPAIFAALQEFEPICGYYLEVFSDFALSDRLRLVVGSRDPALTAEIVAERVAARTRVKPEVVIASPDEVARRTLQEGKRKPVVFFDCRQSGAGPLPA